MASNELVMYIDLNARNKLLSTSIILGLLTQLSGGFGIVFMLAFSIIMIANILSILDGRHTYSKINSCVLFGLSYIAASMIGYVLQLAWASFFP